MEYRLLLDYEAVAYLSALPKSRQRMIHERLLAIQRHPAGCADFTEQDGVGRLLQVSVCGDYSITFWEDSADRHVKVLEIGPADLA